MNDNVYITGGIGVSPARAYYIRYGSSGAVQIGKEFSGTSGVRGTESDVDSAGNVNISGTMSCGTVDFDPGPGTFNLPNSSGNADGSFEYTPNADFNGSDSFTDYASDGSFDSNIATVTIIVNAVNDAPVVESATSSVPEDSADETRVGRVSASDVDGKEFSFGIADGNPGEAFFIDESMGLITAADGSQFDLDTNPRFVLTLEAVDSGSLLRRATVIIDVTDVGESVPVSIDIRPRDEDNTINAKSRGKIAVALLSSATFDARAIDVNSVLFGRNRSDDSLSRNRHGRTRIEIVDVNGDGRLEQLASFETQRTGFQPGDIEGTLTGRTVDGMQSEARDHVSETSPGNSLELTLDPEDIDILFSNESRSKRK